jgi:hypothetical protein
MKLHAPNPEEKFVVLIDSVDGDDTEILFFKTRELAEAHVIEQWGDIPDTTEPGGEEYLDKERPNCVIHIGEILTRTRL